MQSISGRKSHDISDLNVTGSGQKLSEQHTAVSSVDGVKTTRSRYRIVDSHLDTDMIVSSVSSKTL